MFCLVFNYINVFEAILLPILVRTLVTSLDFICVVGIKCMMWCPLSFPLLGRHKHCTTASVLANQNSQVHYFPEWFSLALGRCIAHSQWIFDVCKRGFYPLPQRIHGLEKTTETTTCLVRWYKKLALSSQVWMHIDNMVWLYNDWDYNNNAIMFLRCLILRNIYIIKKNYFYVGKNLNRNNKIVLQKMFALNWDVSIKALNE